jgi:hypothetical protein
LKFRPTWAASLHKLIKTIEKEKNLKILNKARVPLWPKARPIQSVKNFLQ